jgi:hypothetical protein
MKMGIDAFAVGVAVDIVAVEEGLLRTVSGRGHHEEKDRV